MPTRRKSESGPKNTRKKAPGKNVAGKNAGGKPASGKLRTAKNPEKPARKSMAGKNAANKKKAVPAPSEELMQVLATCDFRLVEIALALRAVILEEVPMARELTIETYVIGITYSLTEKWTAGFCTIGIYARHVNLGFMRGVDLHDPKGLLAGSGKQIRHIRVNSVDDLSQPHFREFIRASFDNMTKRLQAGLPIWGAGKSK